MFFGRDRSTLFAHLHRADGNIGRPNRRTSTTATGRSTPRTRAGSATRSTSRQRPGRRLYGRRWGEDLYPESLALREHDGVDQNVFPAVVSRSTWRHAGRAGSPSAATASTRPTRPTPRRTRRERQATTRPRPRRGSSPRSSWCSATSSSVVASAIATPAVVRPARGHRTRRARQVVEQAAVEHGCAMERSAAGGPLRERGLELRGPDSKAVGGTLQTGDLGVPGRNGQLPNPSLRPESGIGGDLGPRRVGPRDTPGEHPRLPEPHRRRHRRQRGEPEPLQTRSVNAGDIARSYGVEVALDQVVSRRVRWFANATYTHSRIQNPIDPTQDGAEIPTCPIGWRTVGASFVPCPTGSPCRRTCARWAPTTTARR